MITKRIFLALCAFATLLPLVGCRNRCCHKETIAAAPCCPTPPPTVLPPIGP